MQKNFQDNKTGPEECFMTIEYFKNQAKNLHKDFKTQKPYFDQELECETYNYAPKFFDIEALITDFEINEELFSRMNALHIITRLCGFRKLEELTQASPAGQELAKLLFDNMHKISIGEWEIYLLDWVFRQKCTHVPHLS